MKVSLNWLKDFVDIDMPADALGHLLTMSGLEVEGIETVGQSLDDIVVARILAVTPVPGSDNLFVCQVDTGHNTVQTVCGAPNVKEGALAPFALPGVRLPNGTVIKEGQIRGEISAGMLLAEDEMGLTDDHTGIMILDHDVTPGSSLPSHLSLSDHVFDVDITPNRPDCACIMGVAREIAAATGQKLKRPTIEIIEDGPPIDDLTRVTVIDPEGCPRYAAGMIQSVTLGPSPFWMRYRLYLSGIRSISNLVDVTNYVMMEMNQPLHAFDYDRLKENRIVVRRAQEGEIFTTLDGVTHTLDSENLLICDGERPVGLAGIMGGLNSEIFAGTENVLVESAFFDPVTIRRGSKRLGLSTEASYRFERGADVGGAVNALKRAISLMSQLAGGRVSTGFIDNYPKIHTPPMIELRVDRTNLLLSTNLSTGDISGYLQALEMDVQEINENELKVTPPSFRVDIGREVDLMEEVARLSGYDNIPVIYPFIRPSEKGEIPELQVRDQLRSIMVGLGFTEIITYSFASPDTADTLGAGEESPLRSFVKILNPLTVDQSVMRTSLIPGLIATARTNILHDEKDLKLFEWGKVFIRKGGRELPVEKNYLAALMTGLYCQKTWNSDERHVDFYDMKGALEVLLDDMGLHGFVFKKETEIPGYDPDVCSSVFCSGSLIGHVGRVSPNVMADYDLTDVNTYLFEIDIEALLNTVSGTKTFSPFTKFPAVYRDISIIVKRQLESAQIVDIIKRQGGELVESVQIFDIYEGQGIDPTEKAMAFRICYRSEHGTLDGEEINRLHESVIERIRQETGGRLREG